MISKIQIEGYKSIKKLDLELNSINILIGSNGAGKSNFISFFKLINNIYEQRLENYSLKQGADNLLFFGNKITQNIKGKLEFDSINEYKINLEYSNNNSLFINEEVVGFNKKIYHNDGWKALLINTNSKESHLKEESRKASISGYVDYYLKTFKVYHFHDTSENSPLRNPSSTNNNLILQTNGGNLAAFLYYLQQKHPENFKEIEVSIKKIAPYFERFELQPDRLNEERIFLEWQEIDKPDFIFNAKHFSDGTLRFIALTTLLLQPNPPKVIIIDEPELGLHPAAVTTLSELIKKAAKKSQIIISTQSVNLTRNFDINDIITVNKNEEGESLFTKIKEDELDSWMADYFYGLELLNQYDHQQLPDENNYFKEIAPLTYETALDNIEKLRNKLSAGNLFGQEKDGLFNSAIHTIYQTFGGEDLYPGIEKKAAMLLYLIIKNHSFTDGNKRIAAFLFLLFLKQNNKLYNFDGTKRIATNTLVALTLMIAKSKTEEKDLIVDLISDFISDKNLLQTNQLIKIFYEAFKRI